MAELRARLKPLFRRSSSTATATSSKSSVSSTTTALGERRGHSKSSLLLSKARKSSLPTHVQEEDLRLPLPPASILGSETQSIAHEPPQTPDTSLETPRLTPLEKLNPTFTLEEPTPDLTPSIPTQHPPSGSLSATEAVEACTTVQASEPSSSSLPASDPPRSASSASRPRSPLARTPSASTATSRPTSLPRRQSLATNNQSHFLHTLLETERLGPDSSDYFAGGPMTVSANMLHRKIWVKRHGQAATMVTISEEDLVDDAKDMILRKYTNSLGRHFDAPDVTLRIVPRDSGHRHGKTERTLGPEEQLSRTLDAYFPGGQNVDEALLIDVPQKRSPRHSPRLPVSYYANDDLRPSESGGDYFPILPIQAQHSPRLTSAVSVSSGHGSSHPPVSMSIVGTGQAPLMPSPGQLGMRHPSSSLISRSARPRHPRQNTSSPTVIGMAKSTIHESLDAHAANVPAAPPLPSPQIPSEGQPHADHAATPPRVASPRPVKGFRKSKKIANATPSLPTGLLDGAVPPINVLIVEDNIINLKLLEAFMKRLKVRWHTAMNGREAVNKWRQGGFHLVLMDIQLPVMNGLDATKEIRRLERLNKIGVFSNSAANTPTFANSIEAIPEGVDEEGGVPAGEDSLMNTALFKSPVIIVALTASSLQSDRHEALAAGCNDFLTKPVNFVWLERKVMEWGCMQALIDFDGWRKWKDFSQAPAQSAALGAKQSSPSGIKNAANGAAIGGGANGAVKSGERKKSLGLLTTGAPGKKERRLGSDAKEGVGSTSGSGSEGSGNGIVVAAGA
ncbi:MAG: hypothetical protein Q9210_003878 [Variospora velana]